MKKSLKDISWDVTEEEYRKDDALSYSILAKYERSGFNGLSHLFDKVESPSLTFGSMVDELITGSMESFEKRFFVADFPILPDSVEQICKALFAEFGTTSISLDNISNDDIIRVAELFNFRANWKPETRAKYIKEHGSQYYKLLFLSKGLTLVSTQDYQDACEAVKALRTSNATKWYFKDDDPFDPVERYYQLKFKSTFNSINYRCMADLILVDTAKKEIWPVDLKTSSKPEWDFHKSFLDWSYSIQARLYWRIINDNIKKHPEFKNYTLKDYTFIVVNRKTLTPLVWVFPQTQWEGDLFYGKDKQIVLRDPTTIGEELSVYLQYECDTPIGINIDNTNNLEEWLNKL